MRILEARFHPRRQLRSDFIRLGYLIWKGRGRRAPPVFEPARAAVSGPVLSKLRYLVGVTGPDSFERLQALRSAHWSFVPITAGGEGPRPAPRRFS
jgi:hypothetical protein